MLPRVMLTTARIPTSNGAWAWAGSVVTDSVRRDECSDLGHGGEEGGREGTTALGSVSFIAVLVAQWAVRRGAEELERRSQREEAKVTTLHNVAYRTNRWCSGLEARLRCKLVDDGLSGAIPRSIIDHFRHRSGDDGPAAVLGRVRVGQSGCKRSRSVGPSAGPARPR